MQRFTLRAVGALTLVSGALALAVSAQAAGKPPSPMTAIHAFIDNFNKGDVAAAEAAHVAQPTIIDEVAPHHWEGAGAVRAWAGDLDKAAKAAGDTNQKVTLGKASRTIIEGDVAYVVVPATYTYKEKGKAMVETASMTYALHLEGDAWKITGWSWNGTAPHLAAPKASPAAAAPATPPKT
ncbi:MAG: nuclear transport factor 2 family protein [Caulobacterales bacterium]|nr:nuclear transport factor 2 family protein [Caulobacterales bacterium]